jgi:hypothetical protein
VALGVDGRFRAGEVVRDVAVEPNVVEPDRVDAFAVGLADLGIVIGGDATLKVPLGRASCLNLFAPSC